MNVKSFEKIDRRVIYAFVILALSVPLIFGYTLTPARMDKADKLYEVIESLDQSSGQIAFVALDFGPNTKAENAPQAEVVIEHLMRRRIPIALFSLYVLSEPFLNSVPEAVAKRLEAEHPGEVWEYGKDWVNLGYRPGGYLIVQQLAKSDNLVELFGKDAFGTPLKEISAFRSVKSLKDISFLGEFTGLVGVFDTYVQFFQSDTYRPKFGHGCTSITVPEAFIYLDSGQLQGLLEGIAGAAWYSDRLSAAFDGRAPDEALIINTGLGVAHLVIILFIIMGNITAFRAYRSRGTR